VLRSILVALRTFAILPASPLRFTRDYTALDASFLSKICDLKEAIVMDCDREW